MENSRPKRKAEEMSLPSIPKSADVLWRIAMILLVAGQYWLETNYISRKEYQEEKKEAMERYQQDQRSQDERMLKISEAVSELNVSLKLFSANKSVIDDHEARLRNLERSHLLP